MQKSGRNAKRAEGFTPAVFSLRITSKSVLIVMGVAAVAQASRPLEPLPTPYFSFDLFSPQISPTGPLQADDVLKTVPEPVPPPPKPERPVVVIDGAQLGMGLPGDELDALSSANRGIPDTVTFAILISVDRATVGQAQPDPGLVNLGVPYNVSDQAARGQAAGDLFMATDLFTKNGMIPGLLRLGGNTALMINNWDEGGTDHSAQPDTSAANSTSNGQDNVNSTAYVDTNGLRGVQPPPVIYFSASRNSPSLGAPGHLPGNSGADLFVAFVDTRMSLPYATASQLGLNPQDDIDSLLVFDEGPAGDLPRFEAGDQVIFSLTADSPSLQMIQNGSAADILSVTTDPTGGPQITFFARAFDLGLMAAAGSTDNVDGLEFFFCADAEDCARRHGIRRVGDMNRDEKVDLFDAHGFWSCFSGPHQQPGYTPPPAACQTPFDTDLDTDVDLADWDLFRHDMTGPL